MLPRRRLAPLLALALLAAACGQAREEEPAVTVLAAASLTDALEEIGAHYFEETGRRVTFSFASSSTLAQQIAAGAPADIFVSANEMWMDDLQGRGLVDAASRVAPIGNSLVLVAPADSNAAELARSAGTRNTILDDPTTSFPLILGEDGRIAVGDPAHVPAGQYAEDALESLGVWELLEPRLAPAVDVRSALALVERGEAPLGIVYATDAAVSDGVEVVGVFPESSHAPITYPFALLAEHSPEAERLFAYMTGEKGLAVFARFGFTEL